MDEKAVLQSRVKNIGGFLRNRELSIATGMQLVSIKKKILSFFFGYLRG